MDLPQGFRLAYLLDGKGRGRRLSWVEVQDWQPEDGLIWVHLDYSDPSIQTWIREESGLDDVICEALLAEETRPRSTPFQDGLMLTLRGVNLNPESDPEDMVAIRLWAEQGRIISTHRRRLLSVDELTQALERGLGPVDTSEFLASLADHLVDNMAGVMENIEDATAELEDRVLSEQGSELRLALSHLRRQAIVLRRYLAPQRDAVAHLQAERIPWLTEKDRLLLREVGDRIVRYVEDLDTVRERATITHEELVSRLSEQLNRRIYILSIVAALFLPLSFLTGLFGVNLGGIPGQSDHAGFAWLIAGLVVTVGIQIWLLRKYRWF
ncbi:MAG: zinc transporter ZntB [Gammaproteobacteria bacterium]